MGIHYPSPVFGPIHSRRLGTSLGINLMPATRKCCNFNCIYCECGWNDPVSIPGHLPTYQEFSVAFENKLRELKAQGVVPDVFTYSGNGEPTSHPDFLRIMRRTVELRNEYFPKAQVCVLSNSGYIHKPDVVEALLLADKRIMKIDSAFADTVDAINQPVKSYSLEATVEGLKQFDGNFTLQTLFMSGNFNGKAIDNTTTEEVEAWLEVVKKLHPKEVMIYTLDRETPADGLFKCPMERMQEIAAMVQKLGLNIHTQIAG